MTQDEILIFDKGLWWFARSRYEGDYRNASDLIVQYVWFLENELDIVARFEEYDGIIKNQIIIRADKKSLVFLELMID